MSSLDLTSSACFGDEVATNAPKVYSKLPDSNLRQDNQEQNVSPIVRGTRRLSGTAKKIGDCDEIPHSDKKHRQSWVCGGSSRNAMGKWKEDRNRTEVSIL